MHDPFPELIRRSRALESKAQECEGVFLDIGRTLDAVLARLRQLEPDFTAMAVQFTRDETLAAEETLRQSIKQCASLSARQAHTHDALTRLHEATARTNRPVSILTGILCEVGALAINAKVEAAQINALHVDFSVFTTEIGRLHQNANHAVTQAATRLQSIAQTLEGSRRTDSPQDDNDLVQLSQQLSLALTSFSRRRARAADTVTAMGAHFREIAALIGDCIRQMQVADLTRQRIEHVREAVELAHALQQGRPEQLPDWVHGLTSERKSRLANAVCHLQKEQALQAADIFRTEIERLRSNILSLAEDARETGQAAEKLCDNSTDDSFLADVEENAHAIDAALAAFAAMHQASQAHIDNISAGFEELAGDMAQIHSIDIDLRLMGLNASLRCNRLGRQGRSLEVVARELRACSHRTQEAATAISSILSAAHDEARTLAAEAFEQHMAATTLKKRIDASMGQLTALAVTVKSELSHLSARSLEVARQLSILVDDIRIHGDIDILATSFAQSVNPPCTQEERDGDWDEQTKADMQRLLQKHYTMQSERSVHDGITAESPPPAASLDDIDQFFF